MIFEIIMLIAAVVSMVKIADFENQSAAKWGAITLGLCLASVVIPLPYARILIAFVVAFVLLTVLKKD